MRFSNRQEAGQKLAEALASYKGQPIVVYAIPRGGVVLGEIIAKALGAPLDLVFVRKVGHPANPEYAICVVTENTLKVCNEEEMSHLNPQDMAKLITEAREEAKRRRATYLKNRPPLDVTGKTAILVDDGVATGLTFITALKDLKTKNPARIIAALPVLPTDTADKIKTEGAELVALQIDPNFLGAVGAYYADFPQLEDEEVIRLLESANKK